MNTNSPAFSGLGVHLENLWRHSPARSRSISPENFTGEKGKGTEDYFCGSYNFDVGKENGGYREFTTPAWKSALAEKSHEREGLGRISLVSKTEMALH